MHVKNIRVQIALASIWLIFTTSLSLWWMIFAMRLIANSPHDYDRNKHMLFLEGLTLLSLLLVGGSVLIYLILKEHSRAQALKNFFSGFTHDVKTRLAGIKLQTEILSADAKGEKQTQFYHRLITDVSRLQVQVENSLHQGELHKLSLYREKIQLKEFLTMLAGSWPQLQFEIHGDALLSTDKRALEIVMTNVFHNAVTHGQATSINCNISELGDFVVLNISDNGVGFSGDKALLGQKFYRHSQTSGSGIGIFTIREFLNYMGGSLEFGNLKYGFECIIRINKGLK